MSFYNENPEGAVFPTPTIGMLGLIDDCDAHATGAAFSAAGDAVLLLTPDTWAYRSSLADLGGAEYLNTGHGITGGDAPHLVLEEERAVQEALLHLIHAGLVRGAHDVSDGGLAVCLAESAIFSATLGADITLSPGENGRLDALLFGEAQSRIVFTCNSKALPDVLKELEGRTVQCRHIGFVQSGTLRIQVQDQVVVDLATQQMAWEYETAIPQIMDGAHDKAVGSDDLAATLWV